MDGWCGVCFGADARTGAPLLCTLGGGSGIAVRLSVGAGRMQIATRLVFTFVFVRENVDGVLGC